MTEPVPAPVPSPDESPTALRDRTWWEHNRTALLALIPLLLLAGLASSYRYQTLYRPNEFTRAQRASGATVTYHDQYQFKGFGVISDVYPRDITLTLNSVTPTPSFQGEQAVKGARLWLVNLQFSAKPSVPVEFCTIEVIDTEGRVYGYVGGKTQVPQDRKPTCVPVDMPGPTIDFSGKLVSDGPERPATWTVERAIALPEGRQPQAVRVSWQPPDYALIPVPPGK